jgi:hypothetical protein
MIFLSGRSLPGFARGMGSISVSGNKLRLPVQGSLSFSLLLLAAITKGESGLAATEIRQSVIGLLFPPDDVSMDSRRSLYVSAWFRNQI